MRRRAMEDEILAQPVRSLQYMLGRLARVYPFLPQLAADGIFGEKTLESVMLFQRELHPPVTGVVDRETWQAIRRAWLEAEEQLDEPRSVRGFPGEGSSLKPGDAAEFLIVPQVMFQVLSRSLNGIEPAPANGKHGTISQQNVRWIQRAGGMKETGVLDWRTWGLLSRLYELFVVYQPKEPREKQEFVGGWG
jgi:hypothetical protein